MTPKKAIIILLAVTLSAVALLLVVYWVQNNFFPDLNKDIVGQGRPSSEDMRAEIEAKKIELLEDLNQLDALASTSPANLSEEESAKAKDALLDDLGTMEKRTAASSSAGEASKDELLKRLEIGD